MQNLTPQIAGIHILLCGSEISQDKVLLQNLQAIANLTVLPSTGPLEQTLRKHETVLLIFELSANFDNELQRIEAIRANFTKLRIIIVDGGDVQEIVIRSFVSGFDDYFKKPVDSSLLAERAKALLKRKQE